MKINQIVLSIILPCVFTTVPSLAKKTTPRLSLSFNMNQKRDTSPKYLRFLRYHELMALSEEKQLLYIKGIQQIFVDLVKAHPRFALNEINDETSPALQSLKQLISKYPQLSLLMSEAIAQAPVADQPELPKIEPINDENAPNRHANYNQYIRFMTLRAPSRCPSARVGNETRPAAVYRATYLDKIRYVCALSIGMDQTCPSGYELTHITGTEQMADQTSRPVKVCARPSTGNDRLRPMQPTDTDPDRPSRASTTPPATTTPMPTPPIPPTTPPPSTATTPAQPPAPTSGSSTGLDGNIRRQRETREPNRPTPSTTTTPSSPAEPPPATSTAPPAPSSSEDRSDYTAEPRSTAVTNFPPDCAAETYACQFGDASRSEAREAFQQDLASRDNNCINGANISNYNLNAQKCSRVSSKSYGEKNFSCSGNKTLCNPLVFGLQSDLQNPICVPLQMNVTLACSEASKRLDGDKPASNALKFLRSNPSIADAWNAWAQSIEKLCQPGTDRNSHRFHCTECTLIFTHLQKLNALTGYANACGNLLSSLGEGDPMIVNAIVDKSLPGVLGRNPQTPSTPTQPASTAPPATTPSTGAQ